MDGIYYWYVNNILEYLMIKERSFINKIMKQEIVFYIIILIVYIGIQDG